MLLSFVKEIEPNVIYSCVVKRLLINLCACREDICGDSCAKPIRAIASEEALAYRDRIAEKDLNSYQSEIALKVTNIDMIEV